MKLKPQYIPTKTVKISRKAKEYTMKGTAARKLLTSMTVDDFEIPEVGTEYNEALSTKEKFNINKSTN